jgi:hypothetical protein
MRIEHLRSVAEQNNARVEAMVCWEDCDRPPQKVYFETQEDFAKGLSCNPHAFLIACVLPAMRQGEERVFVDGEICPELCNGLMTVMSLIRHWYGSERKLVRIEAKTRVNVPTPYTPERAGIFFSGGIDSLASLRMNRLNFPFEHPGSIKDGLLVYGLEVDQPQAFEYVVTSLSDIAQDASITLIPIHTNIRYLDDDWVFYRDEFQGAILSAIAHAFRQRLTTVSIAATFDIANLGPWGSHPLLDPNYSTSDIRIRHDGVAFSRLAKTRLVAGWDVGLQHLRVCNKIQYYSPNTLNCGVCEKCIRTMLALLVLGVLDKTNAFPFGDVSEEMVTGVRIKDSYGESCYQELIDPLSDKGRDDLVRGIKRAIARYRGEVKLKARIAHFDRAYLNGTLTRCKRLILS